MASRESSLIFSLERGLGIALQEKQEKKALTSRGRGLLRGFLELRRPWGFSPEARRGSQGASCAAPWKSGHHGGAWWTRVPGVAQSQTRLRDLAAAAASDEESGVQRFRFS